MNTANAPYALLSDQTRKQAQVRPLAFRLALAHLERAEKLLASAQR